MLSATDTAIRASFFDFTGVVDRPDDLAGQARYLEDAVLLLRDGCVVGLDSWENSEAMLAGHPVIDLRGRLIVPGFVDTHIHYPQTEMIGAFGEQLLEWLNHYTFPVEAQYHCPDHAARMSAFSCISCFPTAPPARWCLAQFIRNRWRRCSAPPKR